MAEDVFCVVSMGMGLLFSCIPKQPKAESFKCTCSNDAYCIAALVVVIPEISQYQKVP